MDRIVVAVDGSEHARLALEWSVREARHHVCPLEVLTVASLEVLVQPTWIVVPPDIDVEQVAKEIQIEALAAVDTTGVEVAEFRPFGPPAAMILDRAIGADLLVMGSRGLGTFLRRILGSVSHQVVTHAPCPVAVVPDRAPPIGRIAVGIDGSEHSVQALRWAWAEAQAHDAVLEVVAAYQWPTPIMASPWFPSLALTDGGEVRDRVADKVDRAVDAVTSSDPSVVRTVLNGAAAPMLLGRAEDADLLVVGSRGQGGFRGLLLGSVSQRCLTHSPCPVVITPGG